VLQEQVLVPGLPGLRCALSAGVALALPGDTAASVFNRADRALYLARARGAQAVGVVQAGGAGVSTLLDQAGAGDRGEGGGD
jgi:GGDEF domain-containing protein